MKRAFKKNELIEIGIEDLTDLGFGVGHADGAAIFISDTVPGDVVRARIIKVNASYLVGRVEEFIQKSEMRVAARCDECKCHSCAYKNISYADEARLKEEGVRRLFSRSELSGITTMPITPSPVELRYRNKAQYPVAELGDDYAIGFYAPKSHRVTPITDCPLTPSVFSKITEVVRKYLKENKIPAYNEQTGKGLIRHIYLRRGEVSGEILLTLVVTSFNLLNTGALIKAITTRFPEVVGILLNKNDKDTNIILGDEYRTLWGRDHIFDTLSGVELKISAPSFYQVNHAAAELLYAKARELAALECGDTLLDLFCGAGSIGLSMVEDAGELIGIEIVEDAVACAKENAKRLGADNAYFFTGDAAETENLLANAERELGRSISPDVIILDPPRGGCDERLIRFVASLSAKRIVYISCNPRTLARDVALFRTLGFDTGAVYPVDLFPMTGHVESVVCLTRRLDN